MTANEAIRAMQVAEWKAHVGGMEGGGRWRWEVQAQARAVILILVPCILGGPSLLNVVDLVLLAVLLRCLHRLRRRRRRCAVSCWACSVSWTCTGRWAQGGGGHDGCRWFKATVRIALHSQSGLQVLHCLMLICSAFCHRQCRSCGCRSWSWNRGCSRRGCSCMSQLKVQPRGRQRRGQVQRPARCTPAAMPLPRL